jgi:hypothetical protein
MTKSEQQEDNGAIWARVQAVANNWVVQKMEQDFVEAMMALPLESAPAGFQSADGQTINGILYEAATAVQLDTWMDANSDRVLFGASLANQVTGDFTGSLVNVDGTTDILNRANLKKLKSVAIKASPRISPTRWNSADNRRYFMAYCGPVPFADLKQDMETTNLDGRPRDVAKNPVFQDGDLLYDGVIVREIPEIDELTEGAWSSTASADDLLTAGAAGVRVNPVFLCGQGALGLPVAEMPTTTTKKEDDYQHNPGRGVESMYGVGKLFKKVEGTSDLKQWGIATGFFGNSAQ